MIPFIFSFFVFLSLLMIGAEALAVWSNPVASPPACPPGAPGCASPVLVGTGPQTKKGGLIINNITEIHGSIQVGGAVPVFIGPASGGWSPAPAFPPACPVGSPGCTDGFLNVGPTEQTRIGSLTLHNSFGAAKLTAKGVAIGQEPVSDPDFIIQAYSCPNIPADCGNFISTCDGGISFEPECQTERSGGSIAKANQETSLAAIRRLLPPPPPSPTCVTVTQACVPINL